MYQNNHDDHDDDDHHAMKEEESDMKSMRSKVDYWSGYYDFLINEGSYKFWAVFQVSFDEFQIWYSIYEKDKNIIYQDIFKIFLNNIRK